MSLCPLLENGFLLLKEDEKYASPIATLFYEKYNNLTILSQRLKKERELLQCEIGRAHV